MASVQIFFVFTVILLKVINGQDAVDSAYIGCFNDSRIDRDLKFTASSANMTPKLCQSICGILSMSYAALQYSMECYCGNSYGKHGRINETSCNYYCLGNKTENCGGLNANSIWFVNLTSLIQPIPPFDRYNDELSEWSIKVNTTNFENVDDSFKLFDIVGINAYIDAMYTKSSMTVQLGIYINRSFYTLTTTLNSTVQATITNMIVAWKRPDLQIYVNCELESIISLSVPEQIAYLSLPSRLEAKLQPYINEITPTIDEALAKCDTKEAKEEPADATIIINSLIDFVKLHLNNLMSIPQYYFKRLW